MPALVESRSGRTITHTLGAGKSVIGRDPKAEIAVSSLVVSFHHAQVFEDGDDWYVEDLQSRNGTSINGARIQQRTRLQHDDRIQLGEVELRFQAEQEVPETQDATSGTGVDLVGDTDDYSFNIVHTLGEAGRFGVEGSRPEEKLKAVLDLSTALAGAFDLEVLPQKILDIIFRVFPQADRGCVMLQDESGEMVPRAVKHRQLVAQSTVRLSRTIVARVLDEKTGVLSKDASCDARFNLSTSINELDIRSMMCVPLLDLDGTPFGIISIDSQRQEYTFDRDDLDLLMAVAGQASLSYENARLVDAFLEKQRQVARLQRKQDELRHFFSPKVMETITLEDADTIMQPRVLEVTVLFCDIRGFSRRSELSQHNLLDLLERCTGALEIMSRNILDQGGVIADFQGDAALGFWGWPTATDDGGALPACRAALAIHREFDEARRKTDHVLADFQVGIGVAHGDAIAGKIGTSRQAKIGVFGPVVNLGSRLESMTKHLSVPIILDEQSAMHVRDEHASTLGRCRRLGRVLPYGMQNPMMIYQLMPPADQDPAISDEDIRLYESAVRNTIDGQWTEAMQLLDQLPTDDQGKEFLKNYLSRHNCQPPEDWSGVIEMSSK